MPIYCYQCPACGYAGTIITSMRRRNHGPHCPKCGPNQKMERNRKTERVNTDITEWHKPVLSDAMGVHPNQVEAHRKAHPDVPITDDGRLIISSGAEEKRIKGILADDFRAR